MMHIHTTAFIMLQPDEKRYNYVSMAMASVAWALPLYTSHFTHTNKFNWHSLCFFFGGSGGGFPSGLRQLLCWMVCDWCMLQLRTCCSWWLLEWSSSDGTLSYVDKCLSFFCFDCVFCGKAGGTFGTLSPSGEMPLTTSLSALCSVWWGEGVSDEMVFCICIIVTLDSAVVCCTCRNLLLVDSVLLYDTALCCEERELICCDERELICCDDV